MPKHDPLPVSGYTAQPAYKVTMVNHFKEVEERLLRELDVMEAGGVETGFDKRWLTTARSHLEQGFMALNRSVFCPERIALPEDKQAD